MQHQLERGVKKSERNNPEDTKAIEGGGGGVSSAGAEVPLQLVERPIVEQADTIQPMAEQISTMQHVEEPSVEQVDLI